MLSLMESWPVFQGRGEAGGGWIREEGGEEQTQGGLGGGGSPCP